MAIDYSKFKTTDDSTPGGFFQNGSVDVGVDNASLANAVRAENAATNAAASEAAADSDAADALLNAERSKGWAVGNSVSGLDSWNNENNAKYWAEHAESHGSGSNFWARVAKSYATGDTEEPEDTENATFGDATDNAKYYSEQAGISASSADTDARNAQGWTVGNTTDASDGWSATNNAKYWAEQSQPDTEGFAIKLTANQGAGNNRQEIAVDTDSSAYITWIHNHSGGGTPPANVTAHVAFDNSHLIPSVAFSRTATVTLSSGTFVSITDIVTSFGTATVGTGDNANVITWTQGNTNPSISDSPLKLSFRVNWTDPDGNSGGHQESVELIVAHIAYTRLGTSFSNVLTAYTYYGAYHNGSQITFNNSSGTAPMTAYLLVDTSDTDSITFETTKGFAVEASIVGHESILNDPVYSFGTVEAGDTNVIVIGGL